LHSMSHGISLTMNRSNFHEWGAASPENFIVGVIPSSAELTTENTENKLLTNP
jgi:hypothetical protein